MRTPVQTGHSLGSRNTVCGKLVGRAKNVHPTCTTASVQVIQGSLLRDTVSIHELESITIPVSSSLDNRVELRGRCGSERDTVVVWKDRTRPSFGSVNVFSSDGSLCLEPIDLSDDGYWNTSDYQAAVRLNGAVEVVVDGIVGRLTGVVPGTHSASLRLIDGCGRRSASRTVEFIVSSGGYLVDPDTESPDSCGPGQERNARDQCVTVSCDGDLGWIFDPGCIY